MIKRHETVFVKEMDILMQCGKPVMYELSIDGIYEVPYKTIPTKGEHDYITCSGCINTRDSLVERLSVKFNGTGAKRGFPFCCEAHSELVKLKEFNRTSFLDVPELVSDKIIYTNQHITNNHKTENYFRDITDYIQYTVDSFGQNPNGCGEPLFLGDYLFYVSDLLKGNVEITEQRKNKIQHFIENFQLNVPEKSTSLNILISTYEKWLKIFPFELSFFSNLKSHFESRLPYIKGGLVENKYSGRLSVSVHTKNTLIESLLKTTNELLTEINTSELFEKGLLNEPEKISLELIINARKLKLKEGYVNDLDIEKKRYLKILKEWFKDEKAFIKEITPFIASIPVEPSIITKEELFDMQNHLIPKIGIDKVYKAFEFFILTQSKTGEYYLTNEQLLIFIENTFVKKNPVKQKWNCSDFTKYKVREIFYNFYSKSKNSEPNEKNLKRKYFDIMNDSFEGFKETDFTDFAKCNM